MVARNQFQKDPMNSMNRFTKILLLAGIAFTLYGYICRAAGIYFFWESKYIGWSLLFLGTITFLLSRVKRKKSQGRKSLLEKILIGILVFILSLQVVLVIVFPNTKAYLVSK